jgi:hypothetical protein
MLVFPQLVQFPVVKRRTARTVLNRMADGRSIRLADPGGEITEWQLKYGELSDDEAQLLEGFFTAAEGTLNSFLFVDPLANLLDASAWVTGPLLSMTGGPEEWHVANPGTGPQGVTQTISGPAGFVYCFSGSLRADQPCTVTLMAASKRADWAVSTAWGRFTLTAQTDDPTFGVEVDAGSAVDLKDMQVEAQAGASVYRASTSGGVYEDARLRDDSLEIVTVGPNRHACTVKVIHANHI